MRIIIPAFLKKQTTTQAAFIIAIISFLSKVFGFFREVLVAKYFGATGQTDAFLVALIIPSLILGLFSNGFNTLIIPLYLEKKSQSEQLARRFVDSIFMVSVNLFLFLSILIFIFAPICVRIIAYGFKGETFSSAVTLTRYLLISGIFTVFTGFFTGLFQAEKQFFLPVSIFFVGNIALVLSLFFLHRVMGINSWVFGQILYTGIPFIILFFVLYSRYNLFHFLKYKYIDWIETKNFAILLLPLVISGSLSILNQIIDKTIASSLDAGSIAALNFASRIWGIPISLLAMPIATAVFPTFSELALARAYREDYKSRLSRTLGLMFYLTIPSTIFLFFLSQPIIRLFFERGAFDPKATALTSFVLKMYVLGLFAHATSPILARAFYSFKDTKTPLLISTTCIALNILLNIFLSRIIGAAGIALATSIVMSINIILFIRFLRNYLIAFKAAFYLDIIKITISSLPIALVCYLSLPIIDNISAASLQGFLSLFTKLFLIGIISIIPFLFLSRILNLEPYLYIKSYVLNLLKELLLKKE